MKISLLAASPLNTYHASRLPIAQPAERLMRSRPFPKSMFPGNKSTLPGESGSIFGVIKPFLVCNFWFFLFAYAKSTPTAVTDASTLCIQNLCLPEK
jgi:hypothetical protein